MAESNATERLEQCVRHHSRTCTCGITEQECIAYAAAEAADGDPDCTTGQPLTVTLEFEAGYRKGAADCAGITARLDGVEDLVVALRALAYAAMTSGGTAGPDVALKDAIRWATDALQKHDTHPPKPISQERRA